MSGDTTRAEHHARSDDAEVRDAKRRLADLLRQRTCRDDAISSAALGGKVGLKATTVRDAVGEIIEEYDLPVVACSDGYYVITDPGQLDRELGRIQDEIDTREEKKRTLAAAFNARRYE